MRLIDVSELKEWVANWYAKNRLYHPYAKNNNIPIPELYDILEQMPSAQPETCAYWDRESNICALHRPSAQPERKKGKWIDDNCSECGQYVYHGDARNYCPNCGADMRGEE